MLIFLKSYHGIKYLSWLQILFDTFLPSNPLETASIITSWTKSTPTDIAAHLSYKSLKKEPNGPNNLCLVLNDWIEQSSEAYHASVLPLN